MESISYFKTMSVSDFHFDDNDYIFIKEDLPMGQADVNVNIWLNEKKRFADLFNGVLYKGKQVIRPEELEEISPVASVSIKNRVGKTRNMKKYRDIVMRW